MIWDAIAWSIGYPVIVKLSNSAESNSQALDNFLLMELRLRWNSHSLDDGNGSSTFTTQCRHRKFSAWHPESRQNPVRDHSKILRVKVKIQFHPSALSSQPPLLRPPLPPPLRSRTAKNQDVNTGLLICPSDCSFACTAHSFAYSAVLSLPVRSATLNCLLARSLSYSRACGKVND